MNTNSPSIYTNYTIDVTEGVLIADGDNRVDWNFLKGEGMFTADGGDGTLSIVYDSGEDETTLSRAVSGTVFRFK